MAMYNSTRIRIRNLLFHIYLGSYMLVGHKFWQSLKYSEREGYIYWGII
jgi:hypothetical protein